MEHPSLSGTTVVNSSIGRFFSPRHGEGGGKRDMSKSRRVRVEKRLRHLLHLPEHGSVNESWRGRL
jgi:hypothetical protein